ncbi:hypothetical protein ACFFS2_00760 [Streptomyces aurantiacus]|uniref:Lipoprotein n=1 Tax=Streptomyces aurantiacus TaxID=47760 RepID=A0A7G1NVN2_9ACTN|nr:hypothetical protein [Streptomyces aurantiacus]MDQ0773493.1 putative small secreted protein [Streptomyces aurantiacus]BCL26672.1 hypothetical protein GCM10017557_15310 [Streptomyces aurantiacus]
MSGRRRRIAGVLIALCVLPLGLTACGTAGERGADASAAAEALEDALGRGDLAALCAALAPQTRSEVEESEKKACVDAIGSQDLPAGGAVRGVDVYGRQARVVLASDTLFLSRFPDGWKVVAAGCRPRPGLPYQCSVEGS